MIRNLKIKFVAITMILVSIIIASVFSIILKTNSKAMESQSIDDLKEIISMSLIDLVKATAYTNGSDMKKLQYTSLFVVTLDKNGTILSQIQNNVSIDDESLQKAIKTAFTDKYNVGTIKQMKLRYLKQVTDSYQKIAFIDITREHETLESLLIILIVTGTTALLAFLIISIFLSSWALKPVEIAWLQQKQFIADASHELKTPLTVLLANMDILEENENDTIKNQIKWINSSKQEAMQMKTLLEEMLFLAKTDKSKREITFEKINVSDILISQILSLEVIAFEKNIDINYENVQEDLYINANEKQIQSLFSILLENACKYSNENTVINVSLKKEQEKIKFEINNFGPIIPKTELTHIFERFYRVEKSRNKEHGGYGLGLSIAKKITDNHNMKIWAESNEQKGTSFKIIMNGTNQN
ncbi:sensor histidine kinase [Peptoanaerobacter stomatis]|uniref:sensor histidine kinase n=1 Tax=Peptoanaerobacter stomatis TaxID=796937 RepID=UPI003FA11D89